MAGAARSAGAEPAYAAPRQIFGAAPNASAVCMEWHPHINHIFCGTSAGSVYAFYDPALSQKGAMLSAGRKCRPKDVNDFILNTAHDNKHLANNRIATDNSIPRMFEFDFNTYFFSR